MKSVHFLGLTLSLISTLSAFADQESDAQHTARAVAILERSCLQCHRGAGSASKSKFDVRDVRSMIENGVVVPGAPEDSMLWLMAHRGTMPPRSNPQLARLVGDDSQILFDWIKEGAKEFPSPVARPFVSIEVTLKAIAADLKKLPDTRTRSRQRYFTLAEAHNSLMVTDDSLLLSRAALSKTLNSLSWEPEIVHPRMIEGTHQTLFAIDVTSLGWTRDHWRAIRGRYPYAIGYSNLDDLTMHNLDTEIQQLTEKSEPLNLVRADWFIATALQPGLYHALLYDLTLPELTMRMPDLSNPANPQHMTATDLERHLDIDVVANILRGEEHAMRCGFTPSGVSGQKGAIWFYVSRKCCLCSVFRRLRFEFRFVTHGLGCPSPIRKASGFSTLPHQLDTLVPAI